MKKIITITFLLLLLCSQVVAQDLITKSDSLEILNIMYILKENRTGCQEDNTIFKQRAYEWFSRYENHQAVKDFYVLSELYSRYEITDYFINYNMLLRAWKQEVSDFIRDSNANAFFKSMDEYYLSISVDEIYTDYIQTAAFICDEKSVDIVLSPTIQEWFYYPKDNVLVLGWQEMVNGYLVFMDDKHITDLVLEIIAKEHISGK